MSDSVGGMAPEPMHDTAMRLMISTELCVLRDLVQSGAFTPDGLHIVNRRLARDRGEARLDALRVAVVNEVIAALVVQVGMDDAYWRYAHRPDVPEDAAELDGDG